ncbi:hypothetical protein D9758_007836 [Tetrapyrgos nigripes]|uniref:Uncharacterized protein n=1 Tax=Tetrapyrgos nigripes TaxID=182062 RepID=A0A8H5D004_9AGAR|nr:hypothetical protein D9758_007836 [Tetrapyrgos nigripes]
MIPSSLVHRHQHAQDSSAEGSSKISPSETTTSIASSKLEIALKKMSKKASMYEYEMKELEAKLSESLGNFRAIDSVIQETLNGLRHNGKQADKALHVQIPFITRQLDESSEILSQLSRSLPKIQSEVSSIRSVYDSGREKAQSLVVDLSWLNTEFYERWRVIIFTSSSPVSLRWKAIMRVLFTISFVICCWLAWIALFGLYRAYRHKLVWGERLIS